ncbi:MAG: putative peptide transporter ATP-binding protein y4tR [Rhodospirillales bacterium]|nr:putative peptide transporter ATP-binding protein y4tR [Rhodospirillales bacterium]
MTENLLEVHGLRTEYRSDGRRFTAVDGIDFTVGPGEILGLVGESGSGKSATLRSILGLIKPPGRVEGRILWRGRDIHGLAPSALQRVRGAEIAMIFQDPMTALNPVLTVGQQIRESLAAHTDLSASDRQRRAIELLDLVGIPAAASRLDDYPYQFSGGIRQRAMIAIALAAKPALLLADEPTTALDVTIQDQIIKLIQRLAAELRMSVILVTHDLGVVAESCDRVAVMYAGRIVETAPVATLFRSPRHAYTLGLLQSMPVGRSPRTPLPFIPGAPPRPGDSLNGCAFAARCAFVGDECRHGRPETRHVGLDHMTLCRRAEALPAALEPA